MAVPGQVSQARAQFLAATPDPLAGQHTCWSPQRHIPSKHHPCQFPEAKSVVLARMGEALTGEMHFPANIG